MRINGLCNQLMIITEYLQGYTEYQKFLLLPCARLLKMYKFSLSGREIFIIIVFMGATAMFVD